MEIFAVEIFVVGIFVVGSLLWNLCCGNRCGIFVEYVLNLCGIFVVEIFGAESLLWNLCCRIFAVEIAVVE